MNRILIDDTLHNITPELVAEEFCKLGSDGMAVFFNAVAAQTADWQNSFCFQLNWVTEDPLLEPAGRVVMREIGEYAYPLEEAK